MVKWATVPPSSDTGAIRERFVHAISKPEAEIDLAEAALLIAAEEYLDLDVDRYRRKLDELAGEAQIRIGDVSLQDPAEFIRRYHAFLFGEIGFRGNEQDYYDPRNSFLNEVLDRRTGLPISLACVYMEVARRLGGPVEGIGFPGHFLAKWVLPDGNEVVVDPFYGQVVSEDDCRNLLRRLSAGQIPYRKELMSVLPARGILARMLANLKGVWNKRGDFPRAISACDRILLLLPDSIGEVKDRGLLWLRLECFGPAYEDLRRFVERAVEGPERRQIREQLPALRRLVDMIA